MGTMTAAGVVLDRNDNPDVLQHRSLVLRLKDLATTTVTGVVTNRDGLPNVL